MAFNDKLSIAEERPEHRLLLSCARIFGGSEREDMIASRIDAAIDWEYLLETADTHRMTSLLYRLLEANGRDAVPHEILEKLQRRYVKSTTSCLIYTAELLRVLEFFDANDIRAIPFKGPTLGHMLYEDPALREFVDLDILVEKQSVFRALKLLEELGYRKIPEYRTAAQSRILDRKNHYLLERIHGRSIVELHWDMVPSYFVLPVPVQKWWERAEPVLFQERRIPMLSAEDLLAALCIHGCKHLWQCLAWFVDLARLLNRRTEMDWDYILEGYRHPDLKRMIFLSLMAARDLPGAGIPQRILELAEQDSAAVRLSGECRQRLFKHRGHRESLRFAQFQLKSKSSWLDRIRFCCRIAFTPVLYEPDILLPRFLTPFSFGLRRIDY